MTGKLTAVEKISSKLKMNLSGVVSQFKPSTFVELQLTDDILLKIGEGLSKLSSSVEFVQVIELM